MPEEEKKDNKDEDKIILEARMHCESCRHKVYKAMIGYPGVEDINIDMKGQKVTLKAPKVDAIKLFATAKKKSGGKVTKLLHPEPKDEKKKEEEKKPTDVIVVLKSHMNCQACIKKVKKAAWKNGAVYNVKVEGDNVTIMGTDLDPKKVCEEVEKRSGKHLEVVPPKKDEKKDEEKKDGDTKDDVKREEKQGTITIVQYACGPEYAPQYFSDENPNACVIM